MGIPDIGKPDSPFLAQEVALLKCAIAADRAVLGICPRTAPRPRRRCEKVHPNTKPGSTPDAPPTPTPELGWLPVSFPFPGGAEPMVMGLHDDMPVFHWHFDTFDLPKLPAPANAPPPPAPPPPTGNSLLSSSKSCKNQAFRFKNRLFGFQWHMELTPKDIEAIVDAGRNDLTRVLGPDAPSKVRHDTEKHYPGYSRLGDRLLRNFVQFLKVY